ncbi:MAG: hypothetical protein IT379_22730 [Deltaproteobacteria bacterium]|nr:hypothetical protein [Deltaproteobacteria bacterium]
MSLVRAYETLVGGSVPPPPTPPPPPSSGPRLRAEYVNQTFPLSEDTFSLPGGAEQYGYIELRNTGSETWRPGVTFLATTEPRDGASPIAGPDWISPSRAATIDREVAPGATGRFAFTVRSPDVPGDYPQFFGPFHEGIGWFGDDGGPPDRWIEVRVTATPALPVDDDADRDGSPADRDCDDTNPALHPGASDTCGDGIDQDCSGADAPCDTPPPAPDASVTPPAPPPTPPPGASTRPLDDDSGCSCRAAGARTGAHSTHAALASLVLAAVLLARRVRRRGATRRSGSA